jgi:hypothetical protein
VRSTRRELRTLLEVAATRPVPHLSPLDVVLDDTVAPTSPDRVVRARPSRRELRILLRIAGSRSTPLPATAFVAAGQARFGTPGPLTVIDRRLRPKRRRTVVLSGAAAAAVMIAVAGGLTGVYGGPAADADLALEDAVNVTVLLPDGTTIDGARGVTLPDGAVVLTGAHGRAAAGNVEIGPGLEATVASGRLELSAGEQAIAADPVVPPDELVAAVASAPASDAATGSTLATPAAAADGATQVATSTADTADSAPPPLSRPLASTLPDLGTLAQAIPKG